MADIREIFRVDDTISRSCPMPDFTIGNMEPINVIMAIRETSLFQN